FTGRSGQTTPEGILSLADRIRDTGGVELGGIHGYAGHAQIQPQEERKARNDKAMRLLSQTIELLREHNHAVPIITGGGTGTAQMDAENKILNAVQAGSFLMLDPAYRKAGVPF